MALSIVGVRGGGQRVEIDIWRPYNRFAHMTSGAADAQGVQSTGTTDEPERILPDRHG